MLITRVITALLLLPIMLGAVFYLSAPLWAVFAWLVVGLALWEFSRMAALQGWPQRLYLACSTLLALGIHQLPAASFALVSKGLLLLSLPVWLILAPMWLARRWALPRGAKAMLLGWLLMLPAWLGFIAWRPDHNAASATQLFAVMGLVWIADIAAYFAGKAFGKRKLAPAISPGKSWEGVAGAVLGVAVYVWMVTRLGWLQLDLPLPLLLPLALGLTAVSVVGDLLESWFKRSAGIKDSSKLLPGHGGVYDRIDSLIAVLSVSAALYTLFA
ncbi:phosphatidate cytidylyltransferase [Vogesella sp. LIG4]|uniref:phosphatidate cytidylyltransferase n=1 Tax=Vogesella sp. LIG4 TaxID=1192162 RepID=UPI00081FC7DE|nr:phosphatidate cytidylyltransferase [Vogesella sp. LIG4]SCK23938.1 phosphatidate cytidylyltransferase [Vogesella sp. LIG4]